jgi:hypothetical protein
MNPEISISFPLASRDSRLHAKETICKGILLGI